MFYDRKPSRELDDTYASAADDRLEEILKRVKAAGADITLDESVPLFMDFNNDSVEVGERRVVEFTLNRTEFQITRDTKTKRIGGAGPKKHLEDVLRPMIETKLKKRPDTEEQWTVVDVEDMF